MKNKSTYSDVDFLTSQVCTLQSQLHSVVAQNNSVLHIFDSEGKVSFSFSALQGTASIEEHGEIWNWLPGDFSISISQVIQGLDTVGAPKNFESIVGIGESKEYWSHSLNYLPCKGLGPSFSLITNNITAKRKTELSLQASQERFKLATEGFLSGIWDWNNINEDTGWWSSNLCQMLGYEKKQLPASQSLFFKHVYPSHKFSLLRLMRNHLQCQTPFKTEISLSNASGKYRWFAISGQASEPKKNGSQRIVGCLIDIHSRKESEEATRKHSIELELKNKELEQFAYIASHDLQEPLRTVASFTELLAEQQDVQLGQDSRKYLGFIKESSARMSAMISGLLDYARIGRNFELRTIDLTALAEETTRVLNVQIEESNAHIEIDPLPTLKGFEPELKSLFQNLISNALKFRKKEVPPSIKITCQRQKNHWLIKVTDNGIGIAEKHQDRIFTIFQRLHGRKEYPGTGIGLSHCQKIVELHHGKLWVESEPEKGSTFCFTLLR